MTLGDSVGICKQYPGKSLFLVGDNFPATKELGRTTVSFLFAGPWLVEDSPGTNYGWVRQSINGARWIKGGVVSLFHFIFILCQVEVERRKFLSKLGGHLLFFLFGNFRGFPVHFVRHIEKRGTGHNFPISLKMTLWNLSLTPVICSHWQVSMQCHWRFCSWIPLLRFIIICSKELYLSADRTRSANGS